MPGGPEIFYDEKVLARNWRQDRLRLRFTMQWQRRGTCLKAENEVWNAGLRGEDSPVAWAIRNACKACTGHPNKGPLKG